MQWRRVDGTPKEQHMEMQRLTQLGTGLEHLYGGGEGHAVGLLDLTALEWELLQKGPRTFLTSSGRLLNERCRAEGRWGVLPYNYSTQAASCMGLQERGRNGETIPLLL